MMITTSAGKYQRALKDKTDSILGYKTNKKEFKQLVYKFKDGEMPISEKVVYALINIDEFITFVKAYNEAKNL